MAYMSAREMLSGLPVKMAEGGVVSANQSVLDFINNNPDASAEAIATQITNSGADLYALADALNIDRSVAQEAYDEANAVNQYYLDAEKRLMAEINADPAAFNAADAYKEILIADAASERGVNVQGALDAGVARSTIDRVFTTPAGSPAYTGPAPTATMAADVQDYYNTVMADDKIDAAERLAMQKIATDQGLSYADIVAAGVDPNILYGTPAVEPIVPVVPDPVVPVVPDPVAAPNPYTQTQAPYTAPTVYQPLPDNTSVYAAGEESLDRTFRDSAPRTEVLDQYGNLTNFDYTPAASLLSATGSGFSFTPPTVTSRPRSLMGTDQVNRLNQGRAAADLRQLSFQPGLSAQEQEDRYNSYAGLLDNPGSYSGGLSRSQIYARQQAEDFRRAGLPPVVDDIGQSGTVQEYLAMFPDVGESFTSQKASGALPANMTLNQFAREHYAKFGIDDMANEMRQRFTLLPQETADVVPGLPGTAVPADLAKFMTPAGGVDPYATDSSNWNLTDGQLAEGMFGRDKDSPYEYRHGGSVKKPQGFADGGTASADLLEKTAGVPGIAKSIYNYGKDVVTAPSPSAKLLADAMGVGMKATNDPVQYGAELLGFDDARQLAIMREAVEINNQMVDANLIPPDFRVRFKEAPEGSPGTRENVSLDGDEEYFNTINHALFSYYAGQNPIAGLGAQIKEVKQGLQQIDRGNNPRTEYLDYFNNQFGLNLAKQGLSPAEAKNAIIDNVANIGGQGTRGRMQRGEEIKAGTDLLTNVQDAKYPWEKYAESAMAKADKIRAEKPQGFADGGSASSEPTAEELTAQLIAMDAQAAPAERPLDQEQTESRNILDRLTSTPFTKEGDRSIFGSALAGIPGAVESAIGYGKDVVTAPSPSAKMLADIFVTGGAMRQSAEEDPLGYLGETLPPFAQVNALNQVDELNKQVNEARRNGNEEEAKRLEKFITVTALGAFPFIKGGVRPKVTSGQGPLKITGPETTSKNMLDELSGKSVTDPLALEAPTLAPEVGEALKMLDEVDNAPALVPEVGDAAKMLDEVDAIPLPLENLNKTEKAALNKSAGRNAKKRELARSVGETFKANYGAENGWAPVTILGAEFKGNTAKVKTKKIPYGFQNPPEGTEVTQWQSQLSDGIVNEVDEIVRRAETGDQAALDILAQANWYRGMRDQLRSEFGGIGDVFADILGTTSAQTNVEQNFNNAVEILRKYSRGDYDGELMAYQKRVDAGERVDGKTLTAMHKADEFPLITKDSGALFNTNSPSSMGALLDMFRTVKAGAAPKTPNFTGNLIGLTNEATVDVWAARMLRRLSGQDRIPPAAEQGVTGTHRVGSTLFEPKVGGEFGFGQEVFRDAANRVNQSGSVQRVNPNLGALGPDDLQAIAWFMEKERWAKNGWTTKSGEGGSLEYEMSLAGSQVPERVAELRREVNAGFKQPKQRKKDTDSAYDLRVMDARTAFEQARRASQDELASLAAPLSRIQLGVAGERPNQPMSGYAQAELAAEFDDVVRDDPSVLTYNLANTYGSFMGDTERALNAEFIVRDNFDMQPLRTRLIEQGKAYDQDAVFLSRVVPDSTPNARPGVEIYFRETITPEQMAVVTERLREKGVDGFTYVTDMRFNDRINRQTRSGDPETAGLTGLRFQYVPEFDDSFDPQNAIESYNKAEDLFRSVLNDTVGDGNVSDARITYYDTEVYFRDDYDEQLSRTVKKGNNGTGGKIPSGANDPQADRGKQFGTELSGDVPDGVVQKASAKEITALNKSGDPLGINVAVDKNGTDYADLIVNGTKKFESRETPSLKPYVGKRVGIVRTGAGPAEVIGSVEIGQPIEVNQRDFNKLRDQHLVAEDSSFNIKKGQTKFLYPMIDPMTTAPQKVTSKGIVARAVPAALPAKRNKITFESFLMPGLGGSLGAARKKLKITPEKIKKYIALNKGTKQKPIPQVMAAAKKLKAGEISTQEYIQIAEEFQPIKPLGAVQKRPTDKAIAMALGKNEADSAGIVGVNIDIPDGTMISSRLDIPAYEFRNTWVVTLHDGTRKSGLAVGYGPTAVLNDVNFTTTSATAALNMATNDTNKGTIARINGSWQNREPAEVEQLARDILSGKAPDADDWVEVGMNPFRHSYFYRKADGMPVASAEEVIQVGPLVLAKKAKTRPIESPEHLIKTPEGTPPTYFKKGGAIERVYNNPRYI